MFNVPMLITLLAVAHFVGDFILQSDKMAINKSKSVWWLSYHSVVYAFVFIWLGFEFAIITACLHWLVDFCTSRIAAYWYDKNRHWFFVTIGADQMLHTVALIWTLWLVYQ